MNAKRMNGTTRKLSRWVAGLVMWAVGVTGAAQAQYGRGLPEAPAPVQNAVATSQWPAVLTARARFMAEGSTDKR